MSFQILKHIHVTCATLSFLLFFVRGIWSLNGSPIMRQRWVKTVPHFVDTALLASALVACVPDPSAFKSGRNMAAWIGLVPKQNSAAARSGSAASPSRATAICGRCWSSAPWR